MREIELETLRIRSGNYDKNLAEFSYQQGWKAAIAAAKETMQREWEMQELYLPVHFMQLLDGLKEQNK